MARPIGIGELMAPLEVGQVPQIRLDEGHGLRPTPILRIESLAPETLRISTRNSRYELRRIDAALSSLRSLAIGPVGIDAQDDSEEHEYARTQVVALEDWPEATSDRFESGARIEIVQERNGQVRELGSGILLVDLVPGQTASFSVGEQIVGTSAIRELVQVSKDSIEILTGNSRYRLRLRGPSEVA